LRKARVWHLCDPSLAAASLGCNAQGLLNGLNTMSYPFETCASMHVRREEESITIETRTALKPMLSSGSMTGAGLA